MPPPRTAEQQPPRRSREEGTSRCPHRAVQRDAAGPTSAQCKSQESGKLVLSSHLGASRNPTMIYRSAKVNEQITFLMFCSFRLIDCQVRNFKGSTSHSGERATFCCIFHVSKMPTYKGLGAFFQSLNFNIPQALNF